jgi:phosphoglycolate phosphatase-like HAD superfamily hydrolase
VIFDIDNTLVDTRRRTLAAAHAFGRQGGSETESLLRASIDHVGWDGAQTGKKLGLQRGTTRSFQRYWDDFFWSSENFKLDAPVRQTVQLARLAKAAGAEVIYLTGRIEDLKRGTIHQLRRLGLPDVDGSHVLCKPSLKVKTAAFKQDAVRRMQRDGSDVCWFISDSRSDVAAIQQRTTVPCVWVDFPVQPDGRAPRIAPGTPTIRIR